MAGFRLTFESPEGRVRRSRAIAAGTTISDGCLVYYDDLRLQLIKRKWHLLGFCLLCADFYDSFLTFSLNDNDFRFKRPLI